MFSPSSAYGEDDPRIDNPSTYDLAYNLDDPLTQRKLVNKDSMASMTSMLTTDSQSSWKRYHDDSTRTNYYYDHATGESRWDLPEGEILVEDGDRGGDENAHDYDKGDDLYISPDKSSHLKQTNSPSSSFDKLGASRVSRLAGNLARSINEEQDNIDRGFKALKQETEHDTFENLKVNASIVAICGTWLQWQSSEGAIFYTQGQSGGQWERPKDFVSTNDILDAPKEPNPTQTMSVSSTMNKKLEPQQMNHDAEKVRVVGKDVESRRKSGGLHEHDDMSELNNNMKLIEDVDEPKPQISLVHVALGSPLDSSLVNSPPYRVSPDKAASSKSPLPPTLSVQSSNSNDDNKTTLEMEQKLDSYTSFIEEESSKFIYNGGAGSYENDNECRNIEDAESCFPSSMAPSADNSVYSEVNDDDGIFTRESKSVFEGEMLPPEVAIVKKKFAEMQAKDRHIGEQFSLEERAQIGLQEESMKRQNNLIELSRDLGELKERANSVRSSFVQVMRKNSTDFDDSDIYGPGYITSGADEVSRQLQENELKKEEYTFEHSASRSLVAQQKWPWSMMVDPETEIIFYRNEETGTFQGDEPAEFKLPRDNEEHYIQVSTPATNKGKGFNIPHIVKVNEDRSIVEYEERCKKEIYERQKNVDATNSQAHGRLKMSDHFMQDLTKIVEADKTSTAAQDLKERRMLAMENLLKEQERRKLLLKKKDYSNHERNCSRKNSLFKLSSMSFIRSLDPDDIAKIMDTECHFKGHGRGFTKMFASFHDDTLSDTRKDERWEEAKIFLDRLRRMDLYPGMTKTIKNDNYSDERLATVTKCLRKSRESFEKHGAFTNMGKKVPRTFAPGIRGVEASSFDPILGPTFQPPSHRFGAGQDPMHIMTSSLPSHFISNMTAAKISDEVMSTVEKANPMPIVGPTTTMSAGDLMSKIQAAKYKELADMARARRNVALDELKQKYDSCRVESHKQKVQGDVIKNHLGSMSNLMLGGEKSWIHSEITKRHLLEATVLLESTLPKPLGVMDTSSYRHTPAHFRCPESMLPQEFLLSIHERTNVEFDVDERWGKVKLACKESSAKTMRKQNYNFAANTTIPKQFSYYIHKSSGCIQSGVPFDLNARCIYNEDRKRVDNFISQGKSALDVPVELVKMRNSTLNFEPPQPKKLERIHRRHTVYMTDSNEGILYYCPSRHLFSATDKFDPSVAFYEPENANPSKSYEELHMRIPAKNIWETLSLGPVDTRDLVKEETPIDDNEEPPQLDPDLAEFMDLACLLKSTISETSKDLVNSVSVTAVNKLMEESMRSEGLELTIPIEENNKLMIQTLQTDNRSFVEEKKRGPLPQLKNSMASPDRGKIHNRWDPPTTSVAETKRDANMIGMITIKLLSCSNLINTDVDTKGGLSDPYVVLSIGNSSRTSKRQKNTLNPYFNEDFKFKWNGTDPLKCLVMDYDMGNGDNEDDHMGDIMIALQKFDFSNGAVYRVYERKLNNVPNGKITLEASFQPISGHIYKYDPPKQVIYFEPEALSDICDHFQNLGIDKRRVIEFGDTKYLSFELFLQEDANDDTEHEYNVLIAEVYRKPRDVVRLLALSKYLLSQGCGQESFVTMVRVLECLSYKENLVTKQDSALLHILAVRMAAKYAKLYAGHKLLRECGSVCPNSAAVIGHSAKYLHRMQLPRESEELFLGSLLLNPTFADALRGYALLLAEQGNLPMALRYLSRVDSSSPCSNLALLEKGWMLELKGDSVEAVALVYQKVIATNERNSLATSNALAALGHLAHVRGDIPKALSFYRRAVNAIDRNDNDVALILRGCAGASIITCPNHTKSETSTEYDDTDQVCAAFRRGLFFMKSSSRWIALLAYGQFTAYVKKDILSAESMLWTAANLSISRTIWPAIALGHYYQYTRNKYSTARRTLLWAKRMRFEENSPTKMQNQSVDDFVALQIALAHLYLEVDNLKDAEEELEAALDMDPNNSPALRCQSLVLWKKNEKIKAFKKIDAAMVEAKNNTFTLRTASIMHAMQGRYNDAFNNMQQAVAISGVASPLAWRALGVMTYLYSMPNSIETRVDVIARAVVYLGRANELVDAVDVESITLMSQMLMELGHFKEAEVHLRAALVISPANSVVLASLALCLVALGYRSPQGVDRINYKLKQSIMLNFSEIISSDDPEELFEAAMNPSLADDVANRNFLDVERNTNNAANLMGISENYTKGENSGMRYVSMSEYSGVNPFKDVQPEVLYWYAMYHLQRYTSHNGGRRAKEAARALFERAARPSDCLPFPLAVYMLGWIHELNDDVDAAERCYVYSVQQDPIEAGDLLRLNNLVKETHEYVTVLAGVSESRHRRTTISKERAKKNKRLAKRSVASGDDEGSEFEDQFNDGAETMFNNMGPTKVYI